MPRGRPGRARYPYPYPYPYTLYLSKLLLLLLLLLLCTTNSTRSHFQNDTNRQLVLRFSGILEFWCETPIWSRKDRDKLGVFLLRKTTENFRNFRRVRNRAYRWIFEFFLHGRLEHAPILPLNLKISGKSSKKNYKNLTENAKNAILSKFFRPPKKFFKKIFAHF